MKPLKLHRKKIDKYIFSYRNTAEFKQLYREDFELQETAFTSKKSNPLILDCGSHIGLSILYFKIHYPSARIISFEPHPLNYEILRKNIENNFLEGVQTYNMALSDHLGNISFFDYSQKGKLPTWSSSTAGPIWSGVLKPQMYKVKATRLSSWLNQPIDFLNLDIEGAELQVLHESAQSLNQVKELAVEYHRTSKNAQVNDFFKIITILKNSGFKLTYYLKDGRRFVPDAKYLKSFEPNVFVIRGIKRILYHPYLKPLYSFLDHLEERPYLASTIIPT